MLGKMSKILSITLVVLAAQLNGSQADETLGHLTYTIFSAFNSTTYGRYGGDPSYHVAIGTMDGSSLVSRDYRVITRKDAATGNLLGEGEDIVLDFGIVRASDRFQINLVPTSVGDFGGLNPSISKIETQPPSVPTLFCVGKALGVCSVASSDTKVVIDVSLSIWDGVGDFTPPSASSKLEFTPIGTESETTDIALAQASPTNECESAGFNITEQTALLTGVSWTVTNDVETKASSPADPIPQLMIKSNSGNTVATIEIPVYDGAGKAAIRQFSPPMPVSLVAGETYSVVISDGGLCSSSPVSKMSLIGTTLSSCSSKCAALVPDGKLPSPQPSGTEISDVPGFCGGLCAVMVPGMDVQDCQQLGGNYLSDNGYGGDQNYQLLLYSSTGLCTAENLADPAFFNDLSVCPTSALESLLDTNSFAATEVQVPSASSVDAGTTISVACECLPGEIEGPRANPPTPGVCWPSVTTSLVCSQGTWTLLPLGTQPACRPFCPAPVPSAPSNTFYDPTDPSDGRVRIGTSYSLGCGGILIFGSGNSSATVTCETNLSGDIEWNIPNENCVLPPTEPPITTVTTTTTTTTTTVEAPTQSLPPPPPASSSSDDDDAVAIGLIIAAVIVLIAILAMVYIQSSRKDHKRKVIFEKKLKEARKSLLGLSEETSDYAAVPRTMQIDGIGADSSEYAAVPRSMQIGGIGAAINATATEDYASRESALAGGGQAPKKFSFSDQPFGSTATEEYMSQQGLASPGLKLDEAGSSIRLVSVRRENPAFRVDGTTPSALI